jgi:quercetin dioxygenase-like cupin family protein
VSNKARFGAIIFGLLLASATAYAQQAVITRTVMQKAEFPGDTYASMIVAVSVIPAGKVPLHTHPGIEMTYLMDGDATLSIDGSPDRHVTSGDSFQIPAGVPHKIENLSPDKPLKLITTYVVEKDKPLVTFVQR